VTEPNRRRTWAIVVAGWAICWAGCGVPSSPPPTAAESASAVKPEDPAVPATAAENEPAVEGTATLASTETPLKPFVELQRYVFTLWQFQRMQHLLEAETHETLGLTPSQIQKFTQEGAQVKRLIQELQTIPSATREATVEREFVPRAKKFQQLIDGELSDEQEFQLLRGVVQKRRGAVAFLLPGVPEHLQLTVAQYTALCRIVDENLKVLNAEGLLNPFELAKLAQRGMQSRQAAEDMLTPEQQARWQELMKK
jgi:hypothetical protein